MDKVAALTDEQRRDLFEQTASARGVHPAIIEKDFWVCWVLKKLFTSEDLSCHLVFKGGTSLSKVYQLIDRFSEDIDLVLNWELLGYGKDGRDPWEEQSSNTKQHQFNAEFNERAQSYIEKTLCPLVQELVASCSGVVPLVSATEAQVVDIQYPNAFALNALRPEVKLEIGPLASWVPSARHVIQPYAAEEFGKVFDDPDCPVVAITAERTFWEKVTILHQQAHRTTAMPRGYSRHYSRHYYDIFRLAASSVKDAAFSDLQLLSDVVEFKQRFYPCTWAHYQNAKRGTLRLLPTGEGSGELADDYRTMQTMIFSTPPSWEDISYSLTELETEINTIPNGREV